MLPVFTPCQREVKMISGLSTVQPVSVTCWTTGQAWTSRRPLSTLEEVWWVDWGVDNTKNLLYLLWMNTVRVLQCISWPAWVPSNGTTSFSAPFKAVLYTWIRRIDHPPSVGGTLPRNTSFIINGGRWAACCGLKATAQVSPGEKQDGLTAWVALDVFFFFFLRLLTDGLLNPHLSLPVCLFFPIRSRCCLCNHHHHLLNSSVPPRAEREA